MLAGYKPSYPQATVDNCAKNPVDNVPTVLPADDRGGEGPAGNGHGYGTPANIF